MDDMDGDFFTRLGAGLAAIGAGIYGAFRLFKADRRGDQKADMTDAAMAQVVQTLREEVARLSERLERVEAANRECEERNATLHLEIVELKKQLQLA